MMTGCPVCPGYGFLLGQLGRLAWWRCRDCGMTFSTPADYDPYDGGEEE